MGQIQVDYNINNIRGLCIIRPTIFGDNRGYFMETYNELDMKNAGLDYYFVQDNQSSSSKGVLRGLHYQKKNPQAKLVRVIHGSVFDVAVDLRPASPTFGKYHGVLLTAENRVQLLIPRGFAHGFLVLTDFAEFCYKCDNYYRPDDEGGIAWNDPELHIEWPGIKGSYTCGASADGYYFADGTPLKMSEKDQKWKNLSETMDR